MKKINCLLIFTHFMNYILYYLNYLCVHIIEIFKGIKENVLLLPTLYPGWTVRVYYDLEPGSALHKAKYSYTSNNICQDKIFI